MEKTNVNEVQNDAGKIAESEFLAISKPEGFGEKEAPTLDELMLPDDVKITSKLIIQLHGQRVDWLMKNKNPNGKMTLEQLGKEIGVCYETIRGITQGRNQSVNVKHCNAIARYFGCSAYFVLGIGDDPHSVLINGELFRVPFIRDNHVDFFRTLHSTQWARIDPELFELVGKLFYADKEIRDAAKTFLKQVFASK